MEVSRFFKKWETWYIRTKNLEYEQPIKYIKSDKVKEWFKVDLIQLSDNSHLARKIKPPFFKIRKILKASFLCLQASFSRNETLIH